MPSLLTRRQLLAAMAASAAALPRRARAASASDRRFLYVYTMGGWDPTMAFASLADSEHVVTEPDAEVATAGDIRFVAHANRPAVAAFLQAYHPRITIFNGVYCTAISHSGALRTTWTSSSDAAGADWPTRIAAAQAHLYAVPYLVIGGPYFGGADGVFVCRAGSANQLADLVSGEATLHADLPQPPPSASGIAAIDAWLLGEGERRSADPNAARARAAAEWTVAHERAGELRSLGASVDLSAGTDFADQLPLAVRALSTGLSRVVSLNHPRQNALTVWDTHANNDSTQAELYQSLFTDLGTLMQLLDREPSPTGVGTLGDITTVVVMSEMGRTPTQNASGGKDHWAFTSVMYISSGAVGGRTVGGFDDYLYGKRVDLATGELSEGGELLSVSTMGATALQMAGLDPRAEGIEADAVEGVLT
jgi:uncharacterized protein (DUF1501 family)